MKVADKNQWVPKAFHSIEELSAELDIIDAAHKAETLTTDGGWTVGQNLEHCGKFMRFSLDGFGPDMKLPLLFRILGKLVFKRMAKNPKGQMKPGIKLPESENPLLPADEVSYEDGMALMRSQVARIANGEQMLHDSPLLGSMTNELWTLVHLNHCRMHFGYLKYE